MDSLQSRKILRRGKEPIPTNRLKTLNIYWNLSVVQLHHFLMIFCKWLPFLLSHFFPLVTPRSNCEELYFRSVHSQSSGGEFEMPTPPLPQRESDQQSAHLGSATLVRSGQTHPFLYRANVLEDESIIPGWSEHPSDSGWPAKYQTGERSPAAGDSKFQGPTEAAEIACCSGFSATEKGASAFSGIGENRCSCQKRMRQSKGMSAHAHTHTWPSVTEGCT